MTTAAGVSTVTVASTSAGDGGASACAVSLVFAADFLAAAFLASLGSSGCSARVSPSRWARRRIMSAYASFRDEEGLLADKWSSPASSNVSALVIPSSLASSCSRMFFDAISVTPFPGRARRVARR
jgi:hypothetical protein